MLSALRPREGQPSRAPLAHLTAERPQGGSALTPWGRGCGGGGGSQPCSPARVRE